MEILGKPYKIVYEAKNLTTGLTGINTSLITPSGSIIGPFALTETAFNGIYSKTIILPTSSDEGTYTGVISSPNEGSYSRAYKVNFISPDSVGSGAGGSGQINLGSNKLIGRVKLNKLSGKVKLNKLKGVVKKNKAYGIIKKQNKLIGRLKAAKLTGVLKWNY